MNDRIVSALVVVSEADAARLPSNPDGLNECVAKAEQSMNELAATNGRKVAERPRFVDVHDTGLGYVRLEFHARTDVL